MRKNWLEVNFFYSFWFKIPQTASVFHFIDYGPIVNWSFHVRQKHNNNMLSILFFNIVEIEKLATNNNF